MFTPDRFITDRLRAIDASGIRRVFDLAADLKDPINLSIGQPHFDVPDPIKRAAVGAIEQGRNAYTVTQGTADLNARIRADVKTQFPHWVDDDFATLVISGVSGGLVLALMSCVQPGDEVIIADPYFVMYRHLITLAGGTPVYVDTYPDFQFTAQRIEPHINERTKMVLFNSPSNPTGVVATDDVCRDVAQLCDERNVLLLSDEIYDVFCYEKDAAGRCPSPASHSPNTLLMRGFSKTYAMTGWRLGYVAGPRPIVEQMTKLQQYSFVCAPSMAQVGGLAALDVDMSEHVAAYEAKRDRVVEKLSDAFDLTAPGGAFYAFPKAPGGKATPFVECAIANNLLIIPGNVFSNRDTHFRISYACDDAMLDKGLDLLVKLARG